MLASHNLHKKVYLPVCVSVCIICAAAGVCTKLCAGVNVK